jgi:hypothetical protein
MNGARAPGVRRLLGSHACSALAMSMPWPGLLVAVSQSTHSGIWLSATGAARMTPYVLLSWFAGAGADRPGRTRLVRRSAVSRALVLAATVLLIASGHVLAAVLSATLVVALGTPAFPAIAASLPRLTGDPGGRATELLVTIEVAAFAVGASVGGLVLAVVPGTRTAVASLTGLSFALAAAGAVLLRGLRLPDSAARVGDARRSSVGVGLTTCVRLLTRTRPALRAVIAVVAVNAVIGLMDVALLPMADSSWHSGPSAFGLATAALGLGALGGPAAGRLLGLTASRPGRALFATGLPLALTGITPAAGWALVPLAVAGAASVQVETGSTAAVQRHIPDHLQGSALGMVDALMVGGGLVGAAAAPLLCQIGGAPLVIVVAGVLTIAVSAPVARRTPRPTVRAERAPAPIRAA